MTDAKKEKLPRGIRRRRDGRLRVYLTNADGKPYQPLVTWNLLTENKVPVPETRLVHPGIKLAKDLLTALKGRVLVEKRTGAIEASKRVKIADLFPLVKNDYVARGLKSFDHVQSRWDIHLEPFFANIVASQLSTNHIDGYIDARHAEKAGNGTINRELCVVRRALKLGQRTKPPRVTNVPHFPKLAEPRARQGFLADQTYDALARECSAEGVWLRGIFAVGSNFGWRKSEVLNLKVRHMDFPGRAIRLDPGTTKNGEGRIVRMTNDVFELLRVCAEGKQPQDRIFMPSDGESSFRTAWANACKRAGCPGLLFHDLRRTAARNLRRLGVSEGVVMRIGGWRTRDIFERYNIVDEADLADAASRLDDKRERERLAPERAAEAATATQTGTEPEPRSDEPKAAISNMLQ